ncbi:MAG: MaoC family dehydratase [Anderseniella sp.]
MTGALLHYEDFEVGVASTYGAYPMSADLIREYAHEWDPQPFHLDEELANASVLGGLCASGWQVCSIINKLAVDAYANNSAGLGSFGVEQVKWIKPVYATDILTLRYTVLEKRISAKRPDMGILKVLWEALDQNGNVKTEMTGVNLMKVRNPGAAEAGTGSAT